MTQGSIVLFIFFTYVIFQVSERTIIQFTHLFHHERIFLLNQINQCTYNKNAQFNLMLLECCYKRKGFIVCLSEGSNRYF